MNSNWEKWIEISYGGGWASQVMLVVKNPWANAEDTRDMGSIPGSRRSPGEGNSNPLLYSCLTIPWTEGGWWAIVCGATKSQTRMTD